MYDLVPLSTIFLSVFLTSLALSYFLIFGIRKLKPKRVPTLNANLRVRSAGKVYRCRFLGADRAGWHFSVPLQRDSYVAIGIGELLSVEALCPGGVLLFRSKVINRSEDPHELIVAEPHHVGRLDRRMSPRTLAFEGTEIMIDGHRGTLIDLSSRGAKLESSTLHEQGDRVHILLPWTNEPVGAWILECQPKTGAVRAGSVCRVLFEDTILYPLDKRKAASTMR